MLKPVVELKLLTTEMTSKGSLPLILYLLLYTTPGGAIITELRENIFSVQHLSRSLVYQVQPVIDQCQGLIFCAAHCMELDVCDLFQFENTTCELLGYNFSSAAGLGDTIGMHVKEKQNASLADGIIVLLTSYNSPVIVLLQGLKKGRY